MPGLQLPVTEALSSKLTHVHSTAHKFVVCVADQFEKWTTYTTIIYWQYRMLSRYDLDDPMWFVNIDISRKLSRYLSDSWCLNKLVPLLLSASLIQSNPGAKSAEEAQLFCSRLKAPPSLLFTSWTTNLLSRSRKISFQTVPHLNPCWHKNKYIAYPPKMGMKTGRSVHYIDI